ncbi:MAG TPA: hypothetical protein VMV71_01585 [Candidatus Paceibacterota bacterium]|nr:hypothetical protein [Candidatus Paceibacterota bacterium]
MFDEFLHQVVIGESGIYVPQLQRKQYPSGQPAGGYGVYWQSSREEICLIAYKGDCIGVALIFCSFPVQFWDGGGQGIRAQNEVKLTTKEEVVDFLQKGGCIPTC